MKQQSWEVCHFREIIGMSTTVISYVEIGTFLIYI